MVLSPSSTLHPLCELFTENCFYCCFVCSRFRTLRASEHWIRSYDSPLPLSGMSFKQKSSANCTKWHFLLIWPENFSKLKYRFTKTVPLIVLAWISWLTIKDLNVHKFMVLGNLFSAIGDWFIEGRNQVKVKAFIVKAFYVFVPVQRGWNFVFHLRPFLLPSLFLQRAPLENSRYPYHCNICLVLARVFDRITNGLLRILLLLYGAILSLALWLAVSEWHYRAGINSDGAFNALVRVVGYIELYLSDALMVSWTNAQFPYSTELTTGLYFKGQLLIYLANAM